MSEKRSDPDDDLRPEYDETVLREGVRGKYYDRYREGTNLVPDPDTANEILDESCSDR